MHDLAGQPERRAAGRDHAQAVAGRGQQPAHQLGRRVEHVLAVVHHEQAVEDGGRRGDPVRHVPDPHGQGVAGARVPPPPCRSG